MSVDERSADARSRHDRAGRRSIPARPSGGIPSRIRERVETALAGFAFALLATVLVGGWLVLMEANGWS